MMKATEAGDMGTTVVKGELVLRDATAHPNLVGELWRSRGGVASTRPEMWHHLAMLARFDYFWGSE